MEIVKFLNKNEETEQTIINCSQVLQVSDNLVKIIFNDEIPSDDTFFNGFEIINENTAENMSEDYYHRFTTIYKKEEKSITLSNDESVYVEPEIIEPEPPTLDEIKQAKVNEFSSICSNAITGGVDVTFADDNVEHFSYTEEDQVNLKEIFDLAVQTNVPMYYHADGDGCKLYTVEQIIAIYSTATTNKMHHTTYFNQIRMYIKSLETKEEVEVVEYGQELTGEYLQTYNESMAQAQLVLEALLAQRAAVLAEE